MIAKSVVAIAVLWGGAFSLPGFSQQLVVRTMTPQGTVKGVQQVRIEFSRAMVPFGEPEQADPFSVTCRGPRLTWEGQGRWVDERNWVYNFVKKLPPGLRCRVKAQPSLRSGDGRPLAGSTQFQFATGGPSVVDREPGRWRQLEEDGVFVLKLDAEAKKKSILKNAYFRVEGVENRVPVRLVDGPLRKNVLGIYLRYRSPPTPKELKRLLVLQAKQTFPADAKVQLVWGRGIETLSGVASEEDQVFDYHVRKPFRATLSCTRENRESACSPIDGLRLSFSSRVLREDAMRIKLIDAESNVRQPKIDDTSIYVRSIQFRGPLHEDSTYTVELPQPLQDDAGRTLENQDRFPLTIDTATFPPLLKVPGKFGVLERLAEPVLPITVRNLEAVIAAQDYAPMSRTGVKGRALDFVERYKARLLRIPHEESTSIMPWLHRVARAKRDRSLLSEEVPSSDAFLGRSSVDEGRHALTQREIPISDGGKSFEVVGMPLKEPGFYVVELSSQVLGRSLLAKDQPYYVTAAVQVTNLAVHFKWGRDRSLVWVTRLHNAEPVGQSLVTIQDCMGEVLWRGLTGDDGVAYAEGLPRRSEISRCLEGRKDSRSSDYSRGLLATAQKGDDFAFVHSSWNDGIETWRFPVSRSWDWQEDRRFHTVLDRTLLRAGDTVHMKHFLRQKTMQGFDLIDPQRKDNGVPQWLRITHVGSGQKQQWKLGFDETGSTVSKWAIPQDAKLGVYQVELLDQEKPSWEERHRVARFQVEEFRVPLMEGRLQLSKRSTKTGEPLEADLQVTHLNGGGASLWPVKLRVQPKAIDHLSLAKFPGFTFANGTVQAGTRQSRNSSPTFEIERVDDQLDKNGSIRRQLPTPESERPLRVVVEAEFRDGNGDVRTVSRTQELWPQDEAVGIKVDRWNMRAKAVAAELAVVHRTDGPVANRKVKVEVFREKNFSHRKRLIGGFYGYEYTTQLTAAGTLCEGTTDKDGKLVCQGTVEEAGHYVLVTTAVGPHGSSRAHQKIWVSGASDRRFRSADHNRMDVLSEKERYQPGETGRWQVRMPFAKATALVTLEREGVIEHRVQTLTSDDPFVEWKIDGALAPNVFLSVLALRGRIPGSKPTSMLDLSKPDFRMGMSAVQVGWDRHELDIEVTTKKRRYQVREKVPVTIRAKAPQGQKLPKDASVIIAAVDKGLLQLQPNETWNLLDAMMAERTLMVETQTLAMQVVGKRHFGRKALPDGGGGGEAPTRELFDTLLYWNPTVPLDASGRAIVDVPLNDSLTSFELVAIASAGTHLFGKGSATIETYQDVMVTSGLSDLVRHGDRFQAPFTVRNGSDRPLDLTVRLDINPLSDEYAPKEIRLDPGQSRLLSWDVQAPSSGDQLEFVLTAKAAKGDAQDRLKVVQSLLAPVPVRTYQSRLLALDAPKSFPIQPPKQAQSGRGGIRVQMAPSLVAGLDGLTEYWRTYPFTCLEQQISKAIGLNDKSLWTDLAGKIVSYQDESGLLKYFPASANGSVALTTYVLAISHEQGWTLNPEIQERAVKALQRFLDGKLHDGNSFGGSDHSIKKLAAIEALARYGKVKAQVLEAVGFKPNLWPTSALIDWLAASTRLDVRNADRKKATQVLRSRLTLTGTSMTFSTGDMDGLWWLMISGDVNASRLVLLALDFDLWRQDLPRMTQGLIRRQDRQGHWDLTTANAWGAVAVHKFAQKFERNAVTGTTSIVYGQNKRQADWTKNEPVSEGFDWAPRASDQPFTLSLNHQGEGKPWVTISSRAAIPLQGSRFSGYRLRRQITPVERRTPGQWHVGDVYRVRLQVDAQTTRTWVAVEDPLPPGATVLGSNLQGQSRLLTQKEKTDRYPTFVERRSRSYLAYYEYSPRGGWTVEYTVRLGLPGRFRVPPTRIEAMYDPDSFGELSQEPWEVLP